MPKNLCCFLVKLNLSQNINYNVGVVMPGVNQDCAEIYNKWDNHTGAGKFDYVSMPYVKEHILNSEHKFMVNQIWNHFSSRGNQNETI